ncbi:PH-like domain-containing protein [Nesterenkonia halotolerans]|uniref:PH domain-containing protein n=1 Tax=Nesterenkonia halotolerans TaxID=225325 RepID=A0ABR9J4I9_9MICC|nr:hypothetical protein [Nesterenkonia halotolerans]MBE1513762.1 hypothetical protein [Nesterenkonia halotolerans]
MSAEASLSGLPELTAFAELTLGTRAADMTGTYLGYLGITVAIIAVLVLLIWLGWRGRKRRQKDLPAPEEVPAALLEAEPRAAAEGMVIGTVSAGDYLDRVAVHGLGVRTNGRLEVHPEGVAIFRAGAPNYLIGAQSLEHVRTDRGVVGKFVERDGAFIIGWKLGDHSVETAFRARHASAHQELLTELQSFIRPSDEESARS